ncbi:MAG: radical SAM protein [Anaerolineae bacterium]|jgi:wyosine [tRNA(Phe)-imidazoG37] synthetase (radical SAM superfamily)|nr:radical SAM protein [Anaerolineae bacterium]
MITFGPIPSRRLGFSLGINNIPVKHCSYACTYCQVGPTRPLEIKRSSFYPLEEIVTAVQQKVTEAEKIGQTIDYLSFVPDGEPTLDIHLAEEIRALRQFGIPIAVICNATLINEPEVVDALCLADWVSLKVDSVIETTWRKINRPFGTLKLGKILQGIRSFRDIYPGRLVTETMLLKGINDDSHHVQAVVNYLAQVKPDTAYLSVPIRPPAESNIEIPDADRLADAYRTFIDKLPTTEALFDLEEPAFVSTGNLREDILSITAVHPMREAPLRKMIDSAGGNWQLIQALVAEGLLRELTYNGERFYRRY